MGVSELIQYDYINLEKVLKVFNQKFLIFNPVLSIRGININFIVVIFHYE